MDGWDTSGRKRDGGLRATGSSLGRVLSRIFKRRAPRARSSVLLPARCSHAIDPPAARLNCITPHATRKPTCTEGPGAYALPERLAVP